MLGCRRVEGEWETDCVTSLSIRGQPWRCLSSRKMERALGKDWRWRLLLILNTRPDSVTLSMSWWAPHHPGTRLHFPPWIKIPSVCKMLTIGVGGKGNGGLKSFPVRVEGSEKDRGFWNQDVVWFLFLIANYLGKTVYLLCASFLTCRMDFGRVST